MVSNLACMTPADQVELVNQNFHVPDMTRQFLQYSRIYFRRNETNKKNR